MSSYGLINGTSTAYGGANVIFSVTSLFEIGDLVYVLYEAYKGKYERVCIKKLINVLDMDAVAYIDTFNRFWFETELCTQAAAIQVVEEYIKNRSNECALYPDKCN